MREWCWTCGCYELLVDDIGKRCKSCVESWRPEEKHADP